MQDTEIGDSSAVGCFAANDYGVHDLIGNVWEWTVSANMPYPYRIEDGREHPGEDGVYRVLRGGSWFDSRDFSRCAYRVRARADHRNDDAGFRVVLRPPVARPA
jgi:formylglycine-generating enzyme required for sulfatase activity